MSDAAPELSSIEASLSELIARVASIAQRLEAANRHDATAAELFAVEAALRSGHRRLTKVTNRLR